MSPTQNQADELVLVTGGAGFIGSHTVDRLVSEGCRVVVLDNFSTGKRENLARWEDDPRVPVIETNVADGLFAPLAELTKRLGSIDRIIHLAAQTSVVQSVRNPLEDARVNYAGTIQVMEYARCHQVKKVVFSSSSAVYGDDAPVPVCESAECMPLSPYGVNKLASEMLLHYYALVHGIPVTLLRFFNVYGPRQDPGSPYSGVISIFAERAIAGKMLPIFGEGHQTRDFVYVDDVCRALTMACLSDVADRAVVNIGTGSETSINELARLVVDLCNSTSKIQHYDPRPGEIFRSVTTTKQAEELLGFQATVELRNGLQETLDWVRGPVD